MLSFEQPFSTALTAMTFNFSNISWAHDWAKSPVALIPKTFGRLPNLKSVTIVRYTLDASSWTAIATGLQSNDSITELSLLDTDFTKEALDLFLVHMQSSDDDDTAASRQYIRRLTLNKHLDTRFERFVAIAHMFCRSLLQHIHVGLNVWYRLDEFFAILAATPPVHLRSLTISSRRGAVLPAIAPFVAATSTHVHLEELEIKIDNEHNDFSVPRVDTFVSSLYRNGNLQRVKVAFADPRNNPLARHERLIQSISTRNRLLPRLVSTYFADTGSAAAAGTGSTNKDDTLVVATAVDKDDDDPVRDALPQDFPTLCLAAMRAESQMTPRWVLSGVQAAPADGDDALGQVELPNVGVGDVVGGGSGYSRSSRGKRKRDMSDPSE
jgi:hypothetical protein